MNNTPQTKIAIAVKKGRCQVRRVTYANNGKSTLKPLSTWVSLPEAQAIKRKLESR